VRPELIRGQAAAGAFIKHLGDPRFLRHLASSGLRYERAGRAPSAEILTWFPELEETVVTMGEIQFHAQNMSPMEIYCLLGIVAVRGSRRIFEFGTYDGTTTAHLASSGPDVEIWTLDLPDDQGFLHTQAEQSGTSPRRTGYRYRNSPHARRVRQLYGDSRHYDFSPWTDSIDLVVIDGGHSYETVRSDSANALTMLAPGGIIVWDDYSPVWPDVVKAVDDFGRANRLEPVHVATTGLAVLDLARHAPRESTIARRE
jgi:predicted O-methyltransferase YrrM